jgi:drug/metabolite transporter (DMT)-like permease
VTGPRPQLSAAVAFALLSLACAGVTDVVFKRFSQANQSRGLYVLGMGLTWTIIQSAILLAAGNGLRLDAQTVAFGLVAGLLVAVSNTLLIESLTHIDVGLGSTIYRLNTIAVVVMAVLLLDEPLTGLKLTGVLLGMGAVILLFERHHEHAEARNAFLLFFGLVLLASLLRACFGVLSKVAVLRGVDLKAMLVVNAPVWIAVGAIYAWWRREGLRVTKYTLKYAVISGALICGVANFLMLAVERGQASVVVPIANMSFLVALLISAALGMERLTPRKLTAVALTVAAIAVLTQA